jgi:hypothetical protein
MKESVSLSLIRFRDVKNNPTCATDFIHGDYCDFFRVSKFGTQEVCLFAPEDELLHRRGEDGLGSLIPDKRYCIVWKDEI